jgi:negative regulator of flagellin synthesis FlgM
MKIGSIDTKALPTPAAGERKAGTAGSSGAAEPSAKVALSSAAQGAVQDGDFDTQKVERIAQAIRDGKFRVNPEAIADKLIANATELLGRGPAQ